MLIRIQINKVLNVLHLKLNYHILRSLDFVHLCPLIIKCRFITSGHRILSFLLVLKCTNKDILRENTNNHHPERKYEVG